MIKTIRTLLVCLFGLILPALSARAEIPLTHSMGFPIKGNWWDITGFGFGGDSDFFAGFHLAVDTLVHKTPVGTRLYAPCTGLVRISDNQLFGAYGSDSASNPNFNGHVLLIECRVLNQDGQPQPFTVLLGHVQPGSDEYHPNTGQGLAPVNTVVRKGQYVGRVNHYWHGASQTIDWHHLHFGIRLGAYAPSASVSYVSGYASTGWSQNYTVHKDWVDPTKFVLEHSLPALRHPDGTLVQVYGQSEIYQVVGPELYHVVNEQVFKAHEFDWDQVVMISEHEFDCYTASSKVIDWAPVRKYYQAGEKFFMLEKHDAASTSCALYEFASISAMHSWQNGLKPLEAISQAQLAGLAGACQPGGKLYFRNGSLIKPTEAVDGFGAGAIFTSVNNGECRAFISEQAFGESGYDWNNIKQVAPMYFLPACRMYGEMIAVSEVHSCYSNPEYGGGAVCQDGELSTSYNGAPNTESVGECRPRIQQCVDQVWVEIQSPILPAPELDDGLDNDCDGVADEDFVEPAPLPEPQPKPKPEDQDLDQDGYTPAQGDCNDLNSQINPAMPELDDGLDNNCNGETDEGFEVPDFMQQDFDGDGFTPADGDCNDFDAAISPAAEEVCDERDNDCDQMIDENCFSSLPADPPDDEPPHVPLAGSPEVISCVIECPLPMFAHVWLGGYTYLSNYGQLSFATTQTEVCLRGSPWIDFNCALPDFKLFDPAVAKITCNHDFYAGAGLIEYNGEGEIWFTDFSCYD